MEFELSVTQVNNLLARVGDETPLAKRLSAHGLTNPGAGLRTGFRFWLRSDGAG